MYEEESRFAIVMELMEGKTLDYDCIPELSAINIIRQILLALAACHEKGLVHGDIRPENILRVQEGIDYVKLAGFGFGKVRRRGHYQCKSAMKALLFMSPEVARGEPFNEKNDIWSTGIIAHILLTGLAPDELKQRKNSMIELLNNIRENKFLDQYFDIKNLDSISANAKDFLKQILCTDSKLRGTAKSLLLHPWLEGVSNLKVDLERTIFTVSRGNSGAVKEAKIKKTNSAGIAEEKDEEVVKVQFENNEKIMDFFS